MNFETSMARQSSDIDYLDDARARAKKRRNWLIIAAIVVAILAALAFAKFGGQKEVAVADDSTKQAARVTVVTPGRKDDDFCNRHDCRAAGNARRRFRRGRFGNARVGGSGRLGKGGASARFN